MQPLRLLHRKLPTSCRENAPLWPACSPQPDLLVVAIPGCFVMINLQVKNDDITATKEYIIDTKEYITAKGYHSVAQGLSSFLS